MKNQTQESKQIEIVTEMLYLQSTFNTTTVNKWEVQSLEWTNAIFVESAEAIDSLKWKWWKSGKNDLLNLSVEMIDIWHFIMSYLLDAHSFKVTREIILGHIAHESNLPLIHDTYDRDVMQAYTSAIRQIAVSVELGKTYDTLSSFFNVWLGMGKTLEDLYEGYIIKNCLNSFRQSNGYKDGTYIKQWAIDECQSNDVEDNVVAFKLLNDILDREADAEDNIMTTLFGALEIAYANSCELIKTRA